MGLLADLPGRSELPRSGYKSKRCVGMGASWDVPHTYCSISSTVDLGREDYLAAVPMMIRLDHEHDGEMISLHLLCFICQIQHSLFDEDVLIEPYSGILCGRPYRYSF